MSSAFVGKATLIALFAIGCGQRRAPTEVTHEWRDTAAAAPTMRRIVVLAQNVTPATRHSVEDRFAAKLAEEGIVAVPSYQAMGEQLPPEADEARVALARQGYDGALVVEVGSEARTRTVRKASGYPSFPQAAIKEDVTEEFVTSRAALWDLNRSKAIWSATASSKDPQSGDAIARGLVKRMVPALGDESFAPPNPR